MTFPEAVGLAFAIALIGYLVQDRIARRRQAHQQADAAGRTGTEARLEQRQRDRAISGKDPEQQAADLYAAIDALVAFVEGPAHPVRARSCAAQLSVLIGGDMRGRPISSFLALSESDASPREMQAAAQELALKLAVELRRLRARLRRSGAPTGAPQVAAAGALLESGAERAVAAEAAPVPPPRPAWAREEERIHALAPVSPSSPAPRPARVKRTPRRHQADDAEPRRSGKS